MYLAFLDLECPWLLLGEAFSVDGEHCQGGGVHPCEHKCCRGLDSWLGLKPPAKNIKYLSWRDMYAPACKQG